MNSLVSSKRTQEVIAFPIRKFQFLMKECQNRGKEIYRLNVGDPDLVAPDVFMETIKRYPYSTLNYAPSGGLPECVEAWQQYYSHYGVSLDQKDILVTQGAAEAIYISLLVVADPGDEVLVFEPLYAAYKVFAKLPLDDSEEFIRFLLTDFDVRDKTLMFAPIQDFYLTEGKGKDEVRMAYVLEEAKLRDAMRLLKKALISEKNF